MNQHLVRRVCRLAGSCIVVLLTMPLLGVTKDGKLRSWEGTYDYVLHMRTAIPGKLAEVRGTIVLTNGPTSTSKVPVEQRQALHFYTRALGHEPNGCVSGMPGSSFILWKPTSENSIEFSVTFTVDAGGHFEVFRNDGGFKGVLTRWHAPPLPSGPGGEVTESMEGTYVGPADPSKCFPRAE